MLPYSGLFFHHHGLCDFSSEQYLDLSTFNFQNIDLIKKRFSKVFGTKPLIVLGTMVTVHSPWSLHSTLLMKIPHFFLFCGAAFIKLGGCSQTTSLQCCPTLHWPRHRILLSTFRFLSTRYTRPDGDLWKTQCEFYSAPLKLVNTLAYMILLYEVL